MSGIRRTEYSPETPWLCWVNWPKAQHYQKPSPAWIALYRSVLEDPECTWVWVDEGHAQLGVIVHLMGVIAKHGTTGIMYGAPELLAAELGLDAPPDLSKVVQAGWIRYISLAEKKEIEDALTVSGKKSAGKTPARNGTADRGGGSVGSEAPPLSTATQAPMKEAAAWLQDLLQAGPVPASDAKLRAAKAGYSRRAVQRAKTELGVKRCRKGRGWVWQLPEGQACQHAHQPDQGGPFQRDHSSLKTAFLASKTELDQVTETETGTETVTGTGAQSGLSGAPARNTSLAALAAPPEKETETGQPRAQREPQAQHRPQAQPEPTVTLSLVPTLPRRIPAALGPPGAALPPESDALGVGRAKARNPPPASSRSRASPQLLGSCLGPLAMAEQCPEVWDWVESVYRLLRFPFPINSAEGRRETGSFAAMYNRVIASVLPAGEKTRILVSSLKTAEQKGRKPDSCYHKGKGAVFCQILNQRLNAHLAPTGETVGSGSIGRLNHGPKVQGDR